MIIKWSKNAKDDLEKIITYHLEEKGIRATHKIYSQIEKAVKTLRNFPQMAAIEPLLSSESKEFRALLVTRIYKIIYYIDNNTIVILAIFDCRQNPDKLKDKINDI
jgi:plasmid stabilization system protein ParE